MNFFLTKHEGVMGKNPKSAKSGTSPPLLISIGNHMFLSAIKPKLHEKAY